MGLKMGKIVKMIFKIIKYLILNSILGLVVSVLFYVLLGSVNFSIMIFMVFFIGGLVFE
ncbi:hypothetical protein HMPREF1125_1848 [Streptococcus oralis SK304]|jgi:hypothetical protein|uniref:Uncharacterized protein n=1 Tax=Streptococcus oralis SK304 TaxID=1161421 RepID=J5GCJ7_STROR|nr:hypothetical protein HMPREF1125_1848 [Streptococcus oralis SK304]